MLLEDNFVCLFNDLTLIIGHCFECDLRFTRICPSIICPNNRIYICRAELPNQIKIHNSVNFKKEFDRETIFSLDQFFFLNRKLLKRATENVIGKVNEFVQGNLKENHKAAVVKATIKEKKNDKDERKNEIEEKKFRKKQLK